MVYAVVPGSCSWRWARLSSKTAPLSVLPIQTIGVVASGNGTGAAIQAPIILMSQNRQSEKDRLNAEHDYEINLKAELEIMLLHDKVDLLREGQWRELLALQNEQLKLLQDLHHNRPESDARSESPMHGRALWPSPKII